MAIRKRGRVYWISVSRRGQRIRVSAGVGATKEQAEELQTKILSDLHAGKVGRKPQRLISEAVLKWLDGECKNLKSAKSLESHAAALLPYLNGKYLEQAPQVAADIKMSMNLKAATVNRRLAVLRRVCNLAYREWGWLDQPVAQRVVLLRERNERHVYLTPKQVGELINACQDAGAKDFIRLAVYSGLRRGELHRLTSHDLRDGCLVLDGNTKSGRPRVIPLPPEALSIRIPIGVSDAVLRSNFEAAREAIGMPDLRFHDLRHTYASWLVQGGAPLVAVRDLLGHANLSVTSRYAHLASDHLVDAVSRISGHKSGTRNRRKNGTHS